MPKGIKKCKICGREYEYCRTMVPNTNMFRWQDVACCAEHGAEYLRLVLEARGELPSSEKRAEPVAEQASDTSKKKTRKKKTESAQPIDNKEMA